MTSRGPRATTPSSRSTSPRPTRTSSGRGPTTETFRSRGTAGRHGATSRRAAPALPGGEGEFVAKKHGLGVATHGRGLFVLDNLTPLEEFTPQVAAGDFHLFSTLPAAIRVRPRREGPPASRFTVPNAPQGAMVDYYLRAELKPTDEQKQQRRTPVQIAITDARGDTVTTEYGPSKQGFNRHVWNLRYQAPERLTFEKTQEGEEENPFRPAGGPPAAAGPYIVARTVAGQTAARTVA